MIVTSSLCKNMTFIFVLIEAPDRTVLSQLLSIENDTHCTETYLFKWRQTVMF
jgi:hypothetical protein